MGRGSCRGYWHGRLVFLASGLLLCAFVVAGDGAGE